jgi:hypothetical protein
MKNQSKPGEPITPAPTPQGEQQFPDRLKLALEAAVVAEFQESTVESRQRLEAAWKALRAYAPLPAAEPKETP